MECVRFEMALASGTRLGPYEIQSVLGAGGMGEVYRVRDTKLDRAVAIKILPASFAHDQDRLAGSSARRKRSPRSIIPISRSSTASRRRTGSGLS